VVLCNSNYYLFADDQIEMEDWLRVINQARVGNTTSLPVCHQCTTIITVVLQAAIVLIIGGMLYDAVDSSNHPIACQGNDVCAMC
jgi:cytosine/uracil/thiamine/allantoin permease